MQTSTLIILAVSIAPLILAVPPNTVSNPATTSVNGPSFAKTAIQNLKNQVESSFKDYSKKIDKINETLKDMRENVEKLHQKEAYCKDYVEQALALAKLFVGQELTLRKYTTTDEYPCNQEPCYGQHVQTNPENFYQGIKN